MRNPRRLGYRSTAVLAATLLVAACSPAGPSHDETAAPVKHIDSAELRAWWQSDRDVVVLDVRTEKEFREDGRAPGAVLQTWSYNGKDAEVNALFVDEIQRRFSVDQTLVVLCSHGMRATQATRALDSQGGFTSVYVFDGGYEGHHMKGYPAGDGWKAAELPIDD